MSTGGEDLAVDSAALALAAQGLNGAIGELKSLGTQGSADTGRGFGDLALTGMQLGHSGLTSAFGSFCGRWEWGVRTLVQEGNGFAERLGLSAGISHDEDQYIKDTFKVVTNAAMGNPNLTEEQVEGMSWDQVKADNPISDWQHPDFSAKSVEQAQHDIGQTWKDTGRDLSNGPMGFNPYEQVAKATGHEGDVEAARDQLFGPSPEQRQQQAETGVRTPPGGEG
ncbi:hypothetical protein [Streptomyces sp. RKAG337]|uniref:hypothetical protein n=2 Tax=unclassified Streptomyces TaxID=2593676 RepID=UPI002034676F|nr:hypothetical protein [Streptomyces sp. RKAG337]MCM2425799.1 hypothetical protein [Streptomyces sp. RKAG337]